MFEVRQRISEPALTTHEDCGGEVHRLISPAPFILKGEGWYVTDYPSESRKKAKEAEKSSNGGDSKSDAKSDVKSDAKSTTKSATTTPSAPASAPAPKTD